MSNLTLVINTSHVAKVVAISYNGAKDSINLMGKARAYLPLGAYVIPNYAVLHSTYLKVYLPNTTVAASNAALLIASGVVSTTTLSATASASAASH